MKREQFTFYKSFYESIERLPTKKEKLQAYIAISDYALNGQLPDPKEIKPSVLAVFSICQPILETARARACKRLTDNNLLQQE